MRSKNTRKFKSEQLRSKFGYLTFESIFSKFLNKIDSSIFNSLITTFYKILILKLIYFAQNSQSYSRNLLKR